MQKVFLSRNLTYSSTFTRQRSQDFWCGLQLLYSNDINATGAVTLDGNRSHD